MKRRWMACAVTLALAAACARKAAPAPVKLAGGVSLDAALVDDGRETYLHYCYACHGERGDGHGPAAATMRPPPRDFTQGLFKFAGAPAPSLPTDEALDRTIRRGLHGTPMLAWDLPPRSRAAVIAYLKTLSPRWKEESPQPPIEISRDPWHGRETEAVERGKTVYHVAAAGAGCVACHPAYVTKRELARLTEAVTHEPLTDFNDEMYRSTLRETEYAIERDAKGEAVKNFRELPPDFLFHKVKTAYPLGTIVDGARYTAEAQRRDLYRTIGAGIGGAAMPAWKGVLPEPDLWALAYYVQSLIELRGTEQALSLRAELNGQPPGAPPDKR